MNEKEFMNEKEELKKYISDCLNDIKQQKLNDGDYCMIVYSRSVMHGNKWVKFIYKNISDFEAKVEKDIEKIDDMRAIDFEMRTFD